MPVAADKINEVLADVAEHVAPPTQPEDTAIEIGWDQLSKQQGRTGDQSRESAQPFDGETPGIHDVQRGAQPATLAGFQDARQRTLPWAYTETPWGYAPILMSLAALAVVTPDQVVRDGPVLRYGLVVPTEEAVPNQFEQRLSEVQFSRSSLGQRARTITAEYRDVPTCTPFTVKGMLQNPGSDDWYSREDFRQKASEASSHIRDELEQGCAIATLSQLEDDEEWLVLDGRVPGFGPLYRAAQQVVGISKSHLGSYLIPSLEREIFEELSVGQRSHRFVADSTRNAISCYLKVRDLTEYTVSPFAGIVRLEVYSDHADRLDSICRTLLGHATPVKMGINAWENTLYPIYLCERAAGTRLSEAAKRVRTAMRANQSHS